MDLNNLIEEITRSMSSGNGNNIGGFRQIHNPMFILYFGEQGFCYHERIKEDLTTELGAANINNVGFYKLTLNRENDFTIADENGQTFTDTDGRPMNYVHVIRDRVSQIIQNPNIAIPDAANVKFYCIADSTMFATDAADCEIWYSVGAQLRNIPGIGVDSMLILGLDWNLDELGSGRVHAVHRRIGELVYGNEDDRESFNSVGLVATKCMNNVYYNKCETIADEEKNYNIIQNKYFANLILCTNLNDQRCWHDMVNALYFWQNKTFTISHNYRVKPFKLIIMSTFSAILQHFLIKLNGERINFQQIAEKMTAYVDEIYQNATNLPRNGFQEYLPHREDENFSPETLRIFLEKNHFNIIKQNIEDNYVMLIKKFADSFNAADVRHVENGVEGYGIDNATVFDSIELEEVRDLIAQQCKEFILAYLKKPAIRFFGCAVRNCPLLIEDLNNLLRDIEAQLAAMNVNELDTTVRDYYRQVVEDYYNGNPRKEAEHENIILRFVFDDCSDDPEHICDYPNDNEFIYNRLQRIMNDIVNVVPVYRMPYIDEIIERSTAIHDPAEAVNQAIIKQLIRDIIINHQGWERYKTPFNPYNAVKKCFFVNLNGANAFTEADFTDDNNDGQNTVLLSTNDKNIIEGIYMYHITDQDLQACVN